jgi:hypothetical protein
VAYEKLLFTKVPEESNHLYLVHILTCRCAFTDIPMNQMSIMYDLNNWKSFSSSCLHLSGMLRRTVFVCQNKLSYSVCSGTMEEQHKIYLFHLRTDLTSDLKSVY